MNTKEKHWEDVVRTWKRSGSTQDDFCRAKGIAISFDTGIHMIFPATTSNEQLGRIIHAVNEALCESTGTI